ncbi:hypothetical protein OHA84_37905 (plasmid) [Streptomyces sp. NBC_00513]|uniref:hypothetical protein n=1 Tax=unclassified Streptomyces TaxID=2593676 RepID=UPI002255B737|nr:MULTISPECIES: hypothetical protein [unclassified Streptomyces]MCX5078773.1 hypothetical protein [Streptomyces sp. NBC_00424]WUD46306.1 hypothetical protein OHA84_37905 [Streptomyces sp. NBC_00513]
MGRHAPKRARIVFYDVAQDQVEKMTEAERLRLDPVLVAVSRNPEIGVLSKHGAIREYREDGVRIVYVPTALGTLVLVAYVETD